MKLLPYSLFLLFLFSCKPGNQVPPDGLIVKAQMEKILLDVNLAETYSTMAKDSLHKIGIKNTDSLAVYYKEIFAHYKITPEQFTKSMNWYKSHPEDLDSIYNNIIPVVTRLQSKQVATPAPPPPVNAATPAPPAAPPTPIPASTVKPAKVPVEHK